MALRQRTVTGTVVDGDGLPVDDGQVTFKLTVPIGYTSSHVVVDREFYARTGTDGTFSKSVWCDEDSLRAIDYHVTFPITNGGDSDPDHSADISVPYGDGSPAPIGTLVRESA